MSPAASEIVQELLERSIVTDPAVLAEIGRLLQDVDAVGETIREAAADPHLIGGGANLFHWEDVLSISDAQAAISTFSDPLSPVSQARLLFRLVIFWKKLRGTSVNLNKEEYMVVHSIKNGAADVVSIAKQTALSADQVRELVESLKKRHYRDDVYVIEQSVSGLTTQF